MAGSLRSIIPEVLSTQAVGRATVVMTGEGGQDVIDLLLAASLRITNAKPRRRRKRS